MIKAEVGGPMTELIPEETNNGDEIIWAYIYHPFTQRFLTYEGDKIGAGNDKKLWQVRSYGPRRNGGFVKISCEFGELCMGECQALLDRHRRLELSKDKEVSHLWEIMFVDPEDV